MTNINALTLRARQILAQGDITVAEAIERAVDEAYEAGMGNGSEEVLGRVKAQLVGMGKLETVLTDPQVEELWINSPELVFISKAGVKQRLDIHLTELEVRQLVERLLRASGRRLDRSEPFVDATLSDGSRLHVAIPEITKEHWAINIRKFPKAIYKLGDLIQSKMLSISQGEYLTKSFLSGRNILVSGATAAGKTTLVNAVLNLGADRHRLITVEETFEIKAEHEDWVALQARQANLEGVGEITLRRLVKEALRMRPDRLVVGEVRQAEALDLLVALNSGLSGMCTIHANSAADALAKLKLLPLLSGENIPSFFVAETVDRVIDLVIHCEADSSGTRRIVEILEAKRTTQVDWVPVRL